jgi:HK97 family phage major capsid protein
MDRAAKALADADRRNLALDDDERALINCMAKGYQSVMSDEALVRLDDIEELHGIHSRGLKRPAMPGIKGASAAEKAGIKVHYGAHGEVYELSPQSKAADVTKHGEKPPVGLDRWLAATVLGDQCKDEKALEYAMDVKSLSGSTSGVLIPAAYQGEWIDNVRSNMVLTAAGMTTATMTARTVTSSSIVSDPPVGWRAEGAPLNAGDPTFELQNLVAKSVGVRAQATAELAQDSPNFGAQLLQVMSRALAREIDRVGMVGTGQDNQPRGIINVPGIGIVPAVGAPSNYAPFVNGLQKLMEANVDLDRADRNAIMSPRTWGDLEGLTAQDGQPLMRPKALERMVFRPTNSIPNNLGATNDESISILGDFSELVLGVRMEAVVEALRLQTYASNLQIEFIGWTRVDFLVRRPASFVVLRGIK